MAIEHVVYLEIRIEVPGVSPGKRTYKVQREQVKVPHAERVGLDIPVAPTKTVYKFVEHGDERMPVMVFDEADLRTLLAPQTWGEAPEPSPGVSIRRPVKRTAQALD